MKSFFVDCLIGVALGVGGILPGISSGVLCVIFGIYEKLLDSILHFFQNVKKNFKFLFPICIGVFLGAFILSNFLQYLFLSFPIQTNSLFIGLILGTIPNLVLNLKNNTKQHNSKIKNTTKIIAFLICLAIGVSSVILENSLSITNIQNTNFLYLIFSGFLMSIGVVIPRN